MIQTDSLTRIIKELKQDHEVYEPREDTMLMLEELAKLKLSEKRVLEVGTGSGLLALFCAEKGAEVLATDLSAAALLNVRDACNALGLSVGLVQADLLSGIRARFDYVIFNPPYLPSNTILDAAVDGGEGGKEIIEKFLGQIASSDTFVGSCMLVASSLNEPDKILDKWKQLEFKRLSSRRFLFEEVTVFQISKR